MKILESVDLYWYMYMVQWSASERHKEKKQRLSRDPFLYNGKVRLNFAPIPVIIAFSNILDLASQSSYSLRLSIPPKEGDCGSGCLLGPTQSISERLLFFGALPRVDTGATRTLNSGLAPKRYPTLTRSFAARCGRVADSCDHP